MYETHQTVLILGITKLVATTGSITFVLDR